MPRVLVIIPCYNEENSVAAVVADVLSLGPDYDALVIDDASSDRTPLNARQAGAQVVLLPTNLGIGGAVQTGYRFAARHGYDVAVQADGDGQHPCLEIKRLVQPILSGSSDMVIGSRYLAGNRLKGRVSSLGRVMGSILLSCWAWLLTGARVTDPTSGFRACSTEVIREFASRYPLDYPEPVSAVQILRKNYRVSEISVVMSAREHGRSSIRSLKTVVYMVKVMWTMFLGRLYRQA